jgi:hypothetical protein
MSLNQDEEVWKDIPGYEREYQVSNLGNVRSLDHRVPKFVNRGKSQYYVLLLRRGQSLIPTKQNQGYYYVGLTHGKKMLNHRLVAMAFIPNPDGYKTVDHIDRNPTNNHVSNLRWISQAQQMQNIKHFNGWILYYSSRDRPSKWCFNFQFKDHKIKHYFLTREDAEKFRDEYFEKIGFKRLQ